MKYTVFLVVLLALGAYASPLPETDYEYDPDCVDEDMVGDGDVIVEPAPQFNMNIEPVRPGRVEPAIKLDDLSPTEEPMDGECETTESTGIEEMGCDMNPCGNDCDPAPCSDCPFSPSCVEEPDCLNNENGTSGCNAPTDPCVNEPCGSSCPMDCDLCPFQLGCEAPNNPCDDPVNTCNPECGPVDCGECPENNECDVEDVTPTCEAEEDMGEEAEPDCSNNDCGPAEMKMPHQPLIQEEVEPAHIVPDDLFGEQDIEDVEDCVEEM